ncbi:DNA-methyltransferase [Leptospira santarosai]|uniref:DNA-methyltransferase n=1 Tax=Leptospira santarosai TaxID=28183 RepID=UPI0024AFF43A|nr:site-specific DNA-methyltransferase [Leptospira santarosai]MDI7165360.1 site-specific DNA-methyltransferase [Leptospira santarosai]
MNFEVFQGDAVKKIRELKENERYYGQIDSIVTSPPYYKKRRYLNSNDSNVCFELGREKNTIEYLHNQEQVFLEARPLLKDTATLFINLGDTFRNGQALGIPAGFVRMMKKIGYNFIQEIVWAKSITTQNGNRGSCKPESVTRRFTYSHEYVLFFVVDIKRYFFDSKSVVVPINGIHYENKNSESLIKVTGATEHSLCKSSGQKNYSLTNAEDPKDVKNRIIKNKIKNQDFSARRRSVWQIATPNSRNRHTAIGPEELFEICILAGSPKGALVLDPFVGEGTVGRAAVKNGRKFLGIDLDERSFEEAKSNLEELIGNLFIETRL